MKTSEAKEKVCPFIVSTEIQDWNSGFMYNTENKKCICGGCMAWVWDEAIQENGKPETLQNVGGYCARIGQ